jgi:dTDP-4-dehydrorhamnose reductase
MRILVTGSSGLLGSKVVDKLSKIYEVIPTYATKKIYENSVKLDICFPNEVKEIFNKYKPDITIHAAAITNVDACEIDKETAWLTNAIGTKNIAEACKEFNSKLIYISTDYIFDGEKGMYKEDDKPNPINYYGLTKLQGENFVKEICKDWLILRPSTLYGKHDFKKCFATWVIEELKQNKKLKIATDQFTSPTLTDDLVEIILKLIEKDEKGIFHASGRERISRYEFAMKIAEVFNLDKNLIQPVKMCDLEWKAKRPKDSSLDVTKISKIKKPLNIQEGLEILKKELK